MRIPISVRVRVEDGDEVPAVCVKPPPLYWRIPDDLRERADRQTIARAFECVAEDWWSCVPQDLAERCFQVPFRGMSPTASAAGRSDGWAVVRGLRPVVEWNRKQRTAWARFERELARSIKIAEKTFHDEIRSRTS